MVGCDGNFLMGQKPFGQFLARQAHEVGRSCKAAQKKTITISKSKKVVELPGFPRIKMSTELV
jgi:hypothetical protein